MKARIKFRKDGVMKFVGHLDLLRFFQKALRRARIPVALSAGYSPHPLTSFAQPLGVGLTSEGEYMDLDLSAEIDYAAAVQDLNAVMVPGLMVLNMVPIPDEKKANGMTVLAAARYRLWLLNDRSDSERRREWPPKLLAALADFYAQPVIMVSKKTKRSEKEVDIKPLILDLQPQAAGPKLLLAAGSEQNLKPDLVMQAFFAAAGQNPADYPLHYQRLEMYAREDGRLVPLDQVAGTAE